MSASEFKPTENISQVKVCRCEAGDSNFQTNKSEAGETSPTTCPNCQVLKSGNLLLSSKGIGWTVWKKRWFILTRTSLVFFRSDPNAPLPRGSEPIVTLGGIDLNNTASMIVKEERKTITVVFPDGRDGRTFTLKAETTEDLNEWRSALENALAQAPSVVSTTGQHPIVSTDIIEPVEAAVEQSKDNKFVIGRPAEFALVDADGTTAFLEKALKFIEDYGVKVEGILRQSADVEEVKRRVQDYEKGKNEFSPEEDAHVIGDCIKYILREMPSSPVPASCCTALVRAYRTDKTRRLDAMNRVIYEVFPEPNRQLLQRILKMMQIVGSHKAVNRMSASALAACMAPLLLRPLLLGECEIDSDFSMAGDGSFQLLQAAAAANHAQAIVIIMLEEYDQIFDDIEDGSYSSDAYTESDKEYSTDNDIPEDDGSYGSGEDDVEEDLNDNTEHSSGGRGEFNSNIRIGNADDQVISGPARDDNDKVVQPPGTEDSNQISSLPKVDDTSQMESNIPSQSKQELCESKRSTDHIQNPNDHASSSKAKFVEKTSSSTNESKRNSWGRTSARKDLSSEEADCCRDDDDEAHIVKLENNKNHLQSKITEEVRENTVLQASLERRKETLHERRVALEKEVENLRDQLQKERNLRASLESGLMNMRRGQVSFPSTIDSKTKADLEEVAAAEADIMNLKQKVSDLRGQLNNQSQLSSTSLCESCNNKRLQNADKLVEGEQNAAHSTEIASVKAPPTLGSNSVPDMFWATNQMVQKMLSSKDGQDGPLATRWNFAQKNNPVMNRVQGSGTHLSTKTEESGVAPSSALAKLTNRLNFLKERRALLASEMQNIDLGRPQAQGQGPTHPPKRDSN